MWKVFRQHRRSPSPRRKKPPFRKLLQSRRPGMRRTRFSCPRLQHHKLPPPKKAEQERFLPQSCFAWQPGWRAGCFSALRELPPCRNRSRSKRHKTRNSRRKLRHRKRQARQIPAVRKPRSPCRLWPQPASTCAAPRSRIQAWIWPNPCAGPMPRPSRATLPFFCWKTQPRKALRKPCFLWGNIMILPRNCRGAAFRQT